MRHLKVSGNANTDANKVGGADWDAAHVHEIGDFFPIGVARWFADAGDPVQAFSGRGKVTGQTYASDTVTISHDTTFPLQAGAELAFSATMSIVPDGSYPATFAVNLALPAAGQVELSYLNGPPANVVEIFVTIYAEVVAQ